MNTIYSFLVFLLLISLVFSGCSVIYDVTQRWEFECYALPKSQQEECKEQTMTYEEYEKVRKKEMNL